MRWQRRCYLELMRGLLGGARARQLRGRSKPTARAALVIAALLLLAACRSSTSTPARTSNSHVPSTGVAASITIAVVGDFGNASPNERAVAALVSREQPAWVLSLGDNVYSDRGYQALVGAYYGSFIRKHRFLPVTGNHDYLQGIAAYDRFFGTAGRTRYYVAHISSQVDVFVLDSQAALDSADARKQQKAWLASALKRSTAVFKLVALHHPPYNVGAGHGSTPEFQWDFKAMGASMVLAGHEHNYQRITRAGITYIVDGVGGARLYRCGGAISGLKTCQDNRFGALFLHIDGDGIHGRFLDTSGKQRDSFALPGVG